MKILYVRDKNRFPVGCLAYERLDDEFKFGYSVYNPKDEFNKKLAREVATGRLAKSATSFVSSARDRECILQALTNLLANTSLPSRFRKALLATKKHIETKSKAQLTN